MIIEKSQKPIAIKVNLQNSTTNELSKILQEILQQSNHYYVYKVLSIIVKKVEKQKNKIEKFTKKQITEATLNLLPFFSSNKLTLIKSNQLHKSFYPNYLLENLSLNNRTRHVLQRMKLETIGELLFLQPQSLMRIKNCGTSTISELQKKISIFLLEQDIDVSKNWIEAQ